MTPTEKQIIENLTQLLPKLTEREKAELLAFSEGMAFKASQQTTTDPRPAL